MSHPTLQLGPLGIFGGTFDPIHLGHLQLAQDALECLQLAQIRWIPAGRPPHRSSPAVAAADRLRMVQLAIADHPGFACDPAEVNSTASSYTIHTLERLRAELGADRPLVLLMGADAFAGLTTWHRWQEILHYAHIGLAHRPGYTIDARQLPEALSKEFFLRHQTDPTMLNTAAAGLIVSYPMIQLDISATRIRSLLAEGRSVRYLLPAKVLDYIDQHHLYPKIQTT